MSWSPDETQNIPRQGPEHEGRGPVISQNRIRLVIAEDNVHVQHTVIQLLNQYEDVAIVGVARDGVDAVEVVTRLRPDVVLMDINMPRMNGIRATAEIMRIAPETNVIALTLHAQSDFGQLISDAGAVAYVLKSECSSCLIDVIRRFGPSSDS